MRGFERQGFQNEHVQSALDEITRLVRHRRVPPGVQEEEYASPTDCQEEEERHVSLNFESNSKPRPGGAIYSNNYLIPGNSLDTKMPAC